MSQDSDIKFEAPVDEAIGHPQGNTQNPLDLFFDEYYVLPPPTAPLAPSTGTSQQAHIHSASPAPSVPHWGKQMNYI